MHRSDPTPSLSPADIPEWDYLPEVDLADYLDAHPHQHVFRIFAGVVTLSRSIVRQTSITAHALDLRIDCNELHIGVDTAQPGGAIVLDVSGVDNDSAPGSVVGWKTWAPGTGAAEAGEAGFNGGSIEINALAISTTQTAVSLDLDILQMGGKGGNGQQGYWGADGQAGVQGRDGADTNLQPNPDAGGEQMWFVSDSGQQAGSGSDASPGGPGGNGGPGGAAGSLSLVFGGGLSQRNETPTGGVYSVFSASAPGQVVIRLNQTPGDGGDAGAGGAPGVPGPGGPQHNIFNDGQNGWTIDGPTMVDGGTDGKPANPGAPGTAGSPGTTGNTVLKGDDQPPNSAGGDPTGSSPRSVYVTMDTDLRPNSLRLRFHKAIQAELVALSAGRYTLAQIKSHITWITQAAAYLQYDDVSARCAEINNATEADVAASSLVNATASVPITTFEAMMAKVHAAGQTAIAGADDPSIWAQIASGNLALIASWWAGFSAMSGTPLSGQAEKGLNDGIADWIQSVGDPGELEMVPLDTAAGAEATTSEGTATALEDMTPDMLEAAADAGEGSVLFVGAYAGMLALQGMFGFSFGATLDTAYESYKQSQLKWQIEYGAWEREQQARPIMEAANVARISDENLRKKQRDPYDDYEKIDPMMGRIIAAADAVEAVDGDASKQVVTFDGVWVPAIRDPVMAAAFVALESRGLSIKVNVTLPSTLQIVEGQWYEFELDLEQLAPAQPPFPTRTIVEIYLRNLHLSGAYSMAAMPLLQAGGQVNPVPADPALVAALQLVLGLVLVPAPKNKSVPQTPAVTQAISDIQVVNIGQGTCHLVRGANGLRMLIDVGRDGTVAADKTTDYTALLAWIQSARLVVVLSHWDQDHLRLISEDWLIKLTSSPWLSTSYGLGYTLTAKNTAVTVATNSHLYLAGGDSVPMEVAAEPDVHYVNEAGGLLAAAGLDIPNLYLTTTGGASGKNDCHAVSASVVRRAAGAIDWQMLMPGDCSYRFIAAAQRTALAALEATHHGSARSIAQDPSGVVPAAAAKGVVYFSNGKNNQFGHSAARVWSWYSGQGWANYSETSSAGQSFNISVPQ